MPDGWIPLKMRGRSWAAASGAGAGASSVVIAPSVADRTGASTGPRPARVGYHSADVQPRSRSTMSRAPLRVAVLGAGTVGLEVVRAFAAFPDRLVSADGAPLSLVGVAVRDLDARAPAGRPGRAADRRSRPPRRLARGRCDRRGHGRRRAGPDAHRGRARGRQAGRDREQARRRPSRRGARGARPPDRQRVPVRGRGRGWHPGPRAARGRVGRGSDRRPARHRQRDDEPHPDRHDERRARLRRRPRRGPGGRLRGGRPERRRRGRRRGEQARHPRPARVRHVARPGIDRPPPADRRRRRPARHHRGRRRRSSRRPPRSV